MKLLGKNNELYKDGKITAKGYHVMTISTIFGFCCFLVGRSLYENAVKRADKH